MNIFLKDGHVNLTPYLCLISGMINLPFVAMLFVDRFHAQRKVNCIIICILVLSTVLVIKRGSKRGVYLSNGKVFHKTFSSRKTIDVNRIVAIKVSKSLMGRRFGPLYDLTDEQGNALYTMFLLNGVDDEMVHYSGGDLLFGNEFQPYIICRCIYDPVVINHFKSLNPNLICMTN